MQQNGGHSKRPKNIIFPHIKRTHYQFQQNLPLFTLQLSNFPSFSVHLGPKNFSSVYEMECLRCLEDEPDDLLSTGIIEVGLWELADVSELLFSPELPFLWTHSLLNILLDRDGSNWAPLLLFLLPLLMLFCLPFFTSSPSSFNFSWFICFLRDLQFSDTVLLSHSSSVFVVVEFEASVELFLSDWAALDVALTCSKKRTWTTTLSGRRSFWAACMDASIVSFLTFISPQIFFFSAFIKLGCSWYSCRKK